MNLFNKIPVKKPGKNVFDLSHEKKLSAKMGNLYPIFLSEIVPGDKFRVSSELLLRMAPMLAPVMHRINATIHYFFVPNRLIWSEWEDFITGGRLGTSAPVAPFTGIGYDSVYGRKGSLWDYFGLPIVPNDPLIQSSPTVSVLPFRAYQLIYNEYYRDQNLEAEIPINLTSGEHDIYDEPELFELRKRAWEKDYFTSALPFAQRGAPVGIPLSPDEQAIGYNSDTGVIVSPPSTQAIQVGIDGKIVMAGAPPVKLSIDPGSTINVNDLRISVRLQEWLEKNARGGARFIEQILNHFGVVSKDQRLQRPEYLGGGMSPIVISEVLSTVGTAEAGIEAPQGNMAGHGLGIGRSNQFTKYFEEHGLVIGLLSVLPKTAYQQGLSRAFTRFDKLDYYWPEFANIGEQEIKNSELYFDFYGNDAANTATFGYQSRYAEYKYIPSTVHGDFRDNLSFWHMGRIFESAPALNDTFVKADPTKRIFAVEDPDVDDMYIQIYNSVKAVRPMPYFGVPQL